MSDAFIMRRGGGAALNFKVVGGTIRPSNPKNNTIWINTDQKITSWVIGENRPSEATEGMIYIRMSRNSGMPFNALLKNGIVFGVSSTYQYISGQWVDRSSSVYMDGQWHDDDSLPSEYQQVSYLQSSGTQHIDTEYCITENTEFKLEHMYNTYVSTDWSYGTSAGSSSVFGCQFFSGTGFITYYVGNSSQIAGRIAGGSYQNSKLQVKYFDGVFEVAGSKTTIAINKVGSDNTSSVFLFAINSGGKAANYSKSRFYSCKFYESGVLVRNFVPCYRKADSVAGMYDLVNRRFHTNKGTGTFTLGGNVT